MGSKMARWLLIVILILLFVFLVVARVPAHWGVWAVHQAAPNVRLTGVAGTVWEGRAVGGTVNINGQLVPVENLRWEVRPWSLLALNVCADVQAQVMRQPASGSVCKSPGDVIHASDVQLSAPMRLLAKWANVDLAGPTSLQLQSLRLKGQRVEELQGNLSWRDARWYDGERWFSLGAFAAKLSPGEQGGVRAEIFELDGPFKVELTGNFVPGQEPAIHGVIVPSDQAPAPIRDALQFVGEPAEGGGFRVAWPPGT